MIAVTLALPRSQRLIYFFMKNHPLDYYTTAVNSAEGVLLYVTRVMLFKVNSVLKTLFSAFYYINTSVLLENIPLLKFIKTTFGTRVIHFP